MRIVWILLFSYSLLSACALCKLYTPTALGDIELTTSENILKSVRITWKFGSEFQEELLERYDKNKNAKLDPQERDEVEQIFFDYIKENDYLTKIKYYSSDRNLKSHKNIPLPIIVSKEKFSFAKEGRPIFVYDIEIEKSLKDKMVFYVILQDINRNFNFLIHDVTINTAPPWHIEPNVNANAFFASISSSPLIKQSDEASFQAVDSDTKEDEKSDSQLSKWLETITQKIEYHLKASTLSSWFWLLGFSFVYGLVHASGPGHGKLLVGSYFMSTGRSYQKAAFISSLVGLVHTFSALLLTLVIYLFLDIFFKSFVDDVSFYLTKISAVIIILIALYLLYQRFASKSDVHHSACGCSGCSSKKGNDIWLALSAGMVPCPGTVTIFILAISLGEYLLGFLSALFMSIGMSIVIFFAGTIGVGLSRVSGNFFSSVASYLSLAATLIILFLGLILLLA